MNLTTKRQQVDDLLEDLNSAWKQIKQEKGALQQTQQLGQDISEAQLIVQNIAQNIQQQAHSQIARVVTECIQSVFDNSYSFAIRFEKKRNKTEAVLLLLKDGHELEDPMNEDSGGVVDVAALALRLSCLVLSKPKLRRILILDEAFKSVSAVNQEKTRMMLEQLSENFKVQIIQVTHNPIYETGKVIRI